MGRVPFLRTMATWRALPILDVDSEDDRLYALQLLPEGSRAAKVVRPVSVVRSTDAARRQAELQK